MRILASWSPSAVRRRRVGESVIVIASILATLLIIGRPPTGTVLGLALLVLGGWGARRLFGGRGRSGAAIVVDGPDLVVDGRAMSTAEARYAFVRSRIGALRLVLEGDRTVSVDLRLLRLPRRYERLALLDALQAAGIRRSERGSGEAEAAFVHGEAVDE